MDVSISSLRIYVQDFLIYKMSRQGQTIPQIRQGTTRQILHDASQAQYEEKSIWHKRTDLIDYLAGEMKVGPHYYGPKRKSADFNNLVDQELEKLRRKKTIILWGSNHHTGILRLARVKQTPTKPVMGLETQIPADTTTDRIPIKEAFISILTRGKKANTYKFALARALIEYCRNAPSSVGALDIPYSYFADKFLEYYWHQEYRYKIKQDFKTNSTPKVIQAINRVFKNNSCSNFEEISDEEKRLGRETLLKTVFGHARSKTSLVVPRFQNLSEGSNSVLKKIFYDYDDDAKIVRLRPEAFDFFKNNHKILSMAVLSEWAKFLEKINKSLPMLVAKIEQDEMRRESLVKFRKMYMNHADHCFYCGNKLEIRYIHVDHFLPWSYIFENQAWNMVLACSKCNLKKSASLPQEDFRQELIRRNDRYRGHIRELDHSLRIIDTRFGWKKEIENHYTTCKEYGFRIVRLP